MLENSYKRNPDILNTLSNLSNDEVFTSPKLANRVLDLLPNNIWENKDITFLDPCAKTGIFLREVAKRLLKGLEKETPILEERIKNIYSKQIYGIGITELTSLIARRTLYYTKTPKTKKELSIYKYFNTDDGNIHFRKSNHSWLKSGLCDCCGASKKVYDRDTNLESHAYEFIHNKNFNFLSNSPLFNKMKFDVIIGNPPYQLKDGGNEASAKPIYQYFVQQAIKLNPRYLVMIIPSRWFAGGKGLDDFRDKMLKDRRIRIIHDYINAKDCFPGVEIKGGVNYFLWDRDNKGKCEINSYENNTLISTSKRYLLEENLNIFIRDNFGINILKKILLINKKSFSEIITSRKPFGLPTNNRGHKKSNKNFIPLYIKGGISFTNRDEITDNYQILNRHKVLVPEAIGSGNVGADKVNPIYSKPGECCTETYLAIGRFETKKEAENCISYINTKFFHYLLSLKKITQHTTKNVYEFIPLLNFNENWDDDKLYKKYKLSEDEINFINSKVWNLRKR